MHICLESRLALSKCFANGDVLVFYALQQEFQVTSCVQSHTIINRSSEVQVKAKAGRK